MLLNLHLLEGVYQFDLAIVLERHLYGLRRIRWRKDLEGFE
jgi:hypothetical protein